MVDPVSASITLLGLAVPEAIKGWSQKRLEIAAKILQSKILLDVRYGDFDALQQDKLCSMIHCVGEAVLKGATQNKVILMAELINGALKAKNIDTDRGVYLMNILADMSEAEIILMTEFYSLDKENTDRDEEVSSYMKLREKVVPANYNSEKELEAALGRLIRTGLVVAAAGWDGLVCSVSPLMDELVKLVKIEHFKATW